MVKNPLEMQDMQETQVRSLGREDPLEKEMAIHSRILARKIPWTEEPGGLLSVSHACYAASVMSDSVRPCGL